MVHVLTSIAGVLTRNGVMAAVFRDGSGSVVSHPVIGGTTLERIVYRYRQDELAEYGRRCGLRYLRNGVLDENLVASGWRCCFHQKS